MQAFTNNIQVLIPDLKGWFPNLTRAYGNNGRRPRQKFVFGILQLLFDLKETLKNDNELETITEVNCVSVLSTRSVQKIDKCAFSARNCTVCYAVHSCTY